MKKIFSFFFFFVLLSDISAYAQFEMPENDNINALYRADSTSLNMKNQSYGGNIKLGTAAGHNVYARGKWAEYQSSGYGYFPKYLYEANISLFAASEIQTISLYADSKSDKLYHSDKETDFGFSYFRTIKSWSTPQSTWMFALNYSSRRSFWGGIPIPFLAYRYISRKFIFMAPFYAQWNISETWSANAQWLPVECYKAGIKWMPSKSFFIELQHGINSESFFIANRPEEDESLYLKTAYLSLNPVWKIGEKAELSLMAGWIFRSKYYYGDSYSDVNGLVRTGDGFAGSAALKIFF
ncbi:MAG: hypothetical protein K5838_02845 [Elusimicrobiales bacterium]|nr:hypothetical protein [Elusimicrobiales bacterium]